MPLPIAPLPSPVTSPLDERTAAYDRNFYAFLQAQARALAEAQAQIETLRVALNEARQNPTTVYPPVTF
jgi:hypothetical protein